MITEIHSSETPSAPRDSADADAIMLSNNEVNMTNCYRHCQHFFNRCKDGMIHGDVLISYWMMAGYLSPVESANQAYRKGHGFLWDLIQRGVLKPSDEDSEMIELARSQAIQPCRHGLIPCDATSVGFVEMLDVDRIENMLLTDGMMKKRNHSPDGNYLCRQVFQSKRGLKYIAHFNPTPNSLKPRLETFDNPSVLMLRGFNNDLLPVGAFTFEKFKNLIALEISGSTILNTVPLHPTISKLTQLRYLYLSDPLIEKLPEHLFSRLGELRWIILRGCSCLDFNSNICRLDNLEVLDLSYTSTTEIPFMSPRNLTHVFLRDSNLVNVVFLHLLDRIKVLDLSGNQNLKDIQGRIYSDHLQVLDLSRTQIKHTRFLVDKIHLRNLILRECTSIENLPSMKTLTNLEVLDISGCENILKLPEDVGSLKNMKELNLAGCSRLENLGEALFDQMFCLLKLDLSATKFKHLPSFSKLTSLRKLTLRGLELDSLEVETWASLSNLVELDLHGLKISSLEELKLDSIQFLSNLQILNLSKTSVAILPDISMLGSLKELLLADCRNLKAMPDLQPLTSLETLDLSLSDDPVVKGCQLEVEPETQRFLPLSLRRLVLTNRLGVQRLFPALTSLGNLEFLDLRGTDEIEFSGVPSSKKMGDLRGRRAIAKAVEFHIVYDVGHTAFERFIYEFERLDALILDILRSSASQTADANNNNQANYFKRQFEMLHADMKYIQENIDGLKGSLNWKSSEELLEELMDAATHLSAADFKHDSRNLKQLLRVVVKVKLLIPPTRTNGREAPGKKKQPLFIKSVKNVAGINEGSSLAENHPQTINFLRHSYQSLSNTQKSCLLCFSAFPCNEEDEDKNTGALKKSVVIKKSILIYWWFGEGFIDPLCHQDKPVLEEEDYAKYRHPTANQYRFLQLDDDIWPDGKYHHPTANQYPSLNPTGRKMKHVSTIEDIGKQILEVLTEKRFIETVMKKRRKSGSVCMRHQVHSFVIAQAKIEDFFDFNRESNSCLAPYFTRSKKDCVPKTHDNSVASTKLWANQRNRHRELESVGHVLTLFNVNGSVIDIKPEVFSKMKQLSVLSLGSWGCSENAKHIEIREQKFLEGLKSTTQLRLVSLQGLTTITKLPDSICELTNLVILDLRECGYLEELPSGIGSLKNLTYLDLTDCVILTKMPKGICLLSNLEVLRGFKITREAAAAHKTSSRSWWEKTMKGCVSVIHGKDNQACTVGDLSKLKKLYKLSLIVNVKEFPSHGDLEVLRGMKCLRKLKILWERSFDFDNTSESGSSTRPGEQDVTEQPRSTRFDFDNSSGDEEQHVTEQARTSTRFDSLEKLELWCFPYKTPPDWLNSREFENLEKLYIVGGDLAELNSGPNETIWRNVKTVRMNYLRDMNFYQYISLFPKVTYFENHECDVSESTIKDDEKGLWIPEPFTCLMLEEPPRRRLGIY